MDIDIDIAIDIDIGVDIDIDTFAYITYYVEFRERGEVRRAHGFTYDWHDG